MEHDLKRGEYYCIRELESLFETNFGWFIKGITLRRDKEGNPYVILFTKDYGPRGDRVEGDTLYYEGEGQGRDQVLTHANKALMGSIGTAKPIYGFRRAKGSPDWRFIGMLKVLDCEYVLRKGFMTYEFKLLITDNGLSAVASVKDSEVK